MPNKELTAKEVERIDCYLHSRRFRAKLLVLGVLEGLRRVYRGDRTGLNFLPGKEESKNKMFDWLKRKGLIPSSPRFR